LRRGRIERDISETCRTEEVAAVGPDDVADRVGPDFKGAAKDVAPFEAGRVREIANLLHVALELVPRPAVLLNFPPVNARLLEEIDVDVEDGGREILRQAVQRAAAAPLSCGVIAPGFDQQRVIIVEPFL